MKAYWVEVKNSDYGMYIHADTIGKAKYHYTQVDPELDRCDFVELRASRIQDLDDKPFTDEFVNKNGRYVSDEDFRKDSWLEWCSCLLCHPT